MGLRAALFDWIKYRMWTASRYPDPVLIHARGGIFELTQYIRDCASPTLIRQILRDHGADIHPAAKPVGPWITLHEVTGDFSNLSVGPSAHIGKEVFLDLTDRIIVEGSVAVGMRATILTHVNVGDYPDKPTSKLIPKRHEPTILRRGCSVGAGAVVLCGVEIGEDAVINAGVVVERDVPPRTIVTSSRQRADYRMPARLVERARAAMAGGELESGDDSS